MQVQNNQLIKQEIGNSESISSIHLPFLFDNTQTLLKENMECLNGEFEILDKNNILSKGKFINGRKIGLHKEWHQDQQLKSETVYDCNGFGVMLRCFDNSGHQILQFDFPFLDLYTHMERLILSKCTIPSGRRWISKYYANKRMISSNVIDDALNLDSDLITHILTDNLAKKSFFNDKEGEMVLNKEKFQKVLNKDLVILIKFDGNHINLCKTQIKWTTCNGWGELHIECPEILNSYRLNKHNKKEFLHYSLYFNLYRTTVKHNHKGESLICIKGAQHNLYLQKLDQKHLDLILFGFYCVQNKIDISRGVGDTRKEGEVLELIDICYHASGQYRLQYQDKYQEYLKKLDDIPIPKYPSWNLSIINSLQSGLDVALNQRTPKIIKHYNKLYNSEEYIKFKKQLIEIFNLDEKFIRIIKNYRPK